MKSCLTFVLFSWTIIPGLAIIAPAQFYAQVLGHPLADKCLGNKDGQCVAAVMKLCGVLGKGNTETWRKGNRVLANCATVPTRTAVGTFNGLSFEGHAAVFLSCEAGGIRVRLIYVRDEVLVADSWLLFYAELLFYAARYTDTE